MRKIDRESKAERRRTTVYFRPDKRDDLFFFAILLFFKFYHQSGGTQKKLHTDVLPTEAAFFSSFEISPNRILPYSHLKSIYFLYVA